MMLRRLLTGLRTVQSIVTRNEIANETLTKNIFRTHFAATPPAESALSKAVSLKLNAIPQLNTLSSLLYQNRLIPIQLQQIRTRVYYTYKKAKPTTVQSVYKRFKRLDNGLWIRTRSGRHKHLWKKSSGCKRRSRLHVVCNKRQSWMLERMVGSYWKRNHHYVNDPYAPYHVRNGLDKLKVFNRRPFYP